jgi:hypothetical protein
MGKNLKGDSCVVKLGFGLNFVFDHGRDRIRKVLREDVFFLARRKQS